MFRHPKYYKELRKRNKLAESRQPVVGGQQQSDQAISLTLADGCNSSVRPGPGLKLQAATHDLAEATGLKLQATSNKPQAPSSSKKRPQASSPKQQASSDKPQAASSKI